MKAVKKPNMRHVASRIKQIKPAHLKKLATKQNIKWAAPLCLVLAVGVFLAFRQVGSGNGNGGHKDSQAQAAQQYQEVLQSQVDDKTGAPQDGRDPANQQQSSLAAAASSANAIGMRTDKPASGATANNGGNNPASGNNNDKYLNSSGCYYHYGNGGQCLAAHVAVNGQTSCDAVRSHGGSSHEGFKNGIVVNGENHFHLADDDRDKIVCEPGEG